MAHGCSVALFTAYICSVSALLNVSGWFPVSAQHLNSYRRPGELDGGSELGCDGADS